MSASSLRPRNCEGWLWCALRYDRSQIKTAFASLFRSNRASNIAKSFPTTVATTSLHPRSSLNAQIFIYSVEEKKMIYDKSSIIEDDYSRRETRQSLDFYARVSYTKNLIYTSNTRRGFSQTIQISNPRRYLNYSDGIIMNFTLRSRIINEYLILSRRGCIAQLRPLFSTDFLLAQPLIAAAYPVVIFNF